MKPGGTTRRSVWLWLCAAGGFPFIGVALVVIEFQTNRVAERVGDYLVRTNATRNTTGSVWSRLTSENLARDVIRIDDLPPTTEGLPDAVSRGTYTLERIPTSGLPTFLAIDYRPVDPGIARSTRVLIDAHRVFSIGRRLLSDARLQVSVSETNIAQEVDRTIEQAGGLSASTEDQEPVDSLRADIVRTVSEVIREQRRQAESNRVRTAYSAGHVNQIFLNQVVGGYRGELFEEDRATPTTFTIETRLVADLLAIPFDTEDEE